MQRSLGRWAEVVLARLAAMPVAIQSIAAVLVIAFYAERVWTVYRDSGLFRRIGFDWGLFYSQASALAAGDVAAMYQVDRLGQYVQRLASYTTTPDIPLLQWPSPYPPVLAGLMEPLTLLPPPAAFIIWTLLSLAAALHVLWRAHQLVPDTRPVKLAVIFFTTLPVLQVFLLGQPVLFLASALAEAFLALRRGADFRGGLWLGVLALKPQYGLVLGLLLLWKQRWAAVAGACLSVALVVLGSALAAGPRAILDYASGVSAMGDIRDPYAAAAEMVNWRALIVNARPSIGNSSGVMLFVALAVLTVLAIAWTARGPWRPRTSVLDWQLAAACVGTFLVAYHSHMHGLVLLAVPLAAMWSQARSAPLMRLAILAFVFLPTVIFVGVSGIARGFAIDYDEPLWVVWPVWNVALLATLLAATLLRLRAIGSEQLVVEEPGRIRDSTSAPAYT